MDALKLEIKVKPQGKRNALTRQEDGTWLAELTAPPVDGKANKALIDLLAKHFRCPKAAVTIKHGASGRRKIVVLQGVPA